MEKVKERFTQRDMFGKDISFGDLVLFSYRDDIYVGRIRDIIAKRIELSAVTVKTLIEFKNKMSEIIDYIERFRISPDNAISITSAHEFCLRGTIFNDFDLEKENKLEEKKNKPFNLRTDENFLRFFNANLKTTIALYKNKAIKLFDLHKNEFEFLTYEDFRFYIDQIFINFSDEWVKIVDPEDFQTYIKRK